MTAYIQDKNNAENIVNDSTVLNATNYGNLTYKVDEMQFVMNDLHKYKHTTILASIKDTWASKSWSNTDDGVKSDDEDNYILNGQSVKFTGAGNGDGIHVEKDLNLTTHADAYTSGADDLITIFCYIDSTSYANLTAGGATCKPAIAFHNEVLGTTNNYYWSYIDDQLKAGKNIVKLKKSSFTSAGFPNWATIKGIAVLLSNDDPDDTVSFSVDMILLHTQEFKNFVYKTTNETLSSSVVPQDDNELFVALPQNGVFEITAHIAVNSSSATPDVRIDWNASGDISLIELRYCLGQSVNVSNSNDSGNIKLKAVTSLGEDVQYGMDGSEYTYIKENFIVQTLNDGGTLQLRWAQWSSNASAIAVKPGSYIKVTQLQ
jgi:hypothetical protein